MWQQIIVAVIVVAALAHFCTRYLPAALRRRIVDALRQRGFDQVKMSRLFNLKSGCGDDSGCSSCGSCDTAPPAKADTSAPLKRVIKLHVQR